MNLLSRFFQVGLFIHNQKQQKMIKQFKMQETGLVVGTSILKILWSLTLYVIWSGEHFHCICSVHEESLSIHIFTKMRKCFDNIYLKIR